MSAQLDAALASLALDLKRAEAKTDDLVRSVKLNIEDLSSRPNTARPCTPAYGLDSHTERMVSLHAARAAEAAIRGAYSNALRQANRKHADLDPIHARARKAIDTLGLEGDRFERAVAIFGWGSDEANGSLLGLVRKAWGCPSLRCGHEGGWDDGWDTWTVSNPPGKGRGCEIASFGCASEVEALVVALEAKAAGQ